MSADYSDDVCGRQGRAHRHRATRLCRQRTLIGILSLIALVAGCGTATPPGAPTAVDEAYRSAHPSVTRPTALATVPATVSDLRRRLSTAVAAGAPLVLPRRLPAGWGLSAPYIAVGDGSALPNPETWQGGYRVAFTNGSALLIVTVNPARLPGKGAWTALHLCIAGRAASWRRGPETLVFATRAAPDWRVALLGSGVTQRQLEGFVAALGVWHGSAP